MGNPNDLNAIFSLHDTLWHGQSTDMALSALCILAHCEELLVESGPGRVLFPVLAPVVPHRATANNKTYC